MNTAIATDTFYTPDPLTGRPVRQRTELRRMEPEHVKDENGRTITYTHGIWADGQYIQKLTADEVRGVLYTSQGGWTWDEVISERTPEATR